jgi:ribonuclease P protein component
LLKKRVRLTQSKQITWVMQQGRLYRSSLFLLRCFTTLLHEAPVETVFYSNQQQRTKNTFKVAFVLSKKLSKKAVVRNRIRRRFREVIRLWLLSLTPSPVGEANLPKQLISLVFIPSRNAEEAPLEALQAELLPVLTSFLQQ